MHYIYLYKEAILHYTEALLQSLDSRMAEAEGCKEAEFGFISDAI